MHLFLIYAYMYAIFYQTNRKTYYFTNIFIFLCIYLEYLHINIQKLLLFWWIVRMYLYYSEANFFNLGYCTLSLLMLIFFFYITVFRQILVLSCCWRLVVHPFPNDWNLHVFLQRLLDVVCAIIWVLTKLFVLQKTIISAL